MHWSDAMAARLMESSGTHVIASGITPSGEFHIGHLREILTGDMIARAIHDGGGEARSVFIVDSMDPLRRVYEFLDPSYEAYIGHPLAFIPAPDSEGRPSDRPVQEWSYADAFLAPFLAALDAIGVRPEVIYNHRTYEQGQFAPAIRTLMQRSDEVRAIIERISGRELPPGWSVYNPLGSDGSMDGVEVTGFEDPYVLWRDRHGVTGRSDIRAAEGKLPWRLDWPARWGIHGITCEPFGKDHGASGGSYATGRPIAADVLGHAPPAPLTYEWIELKGMGPMSSSTGNTIGPMEALSLVPAEILRYVIARTKPSKHISFDTGSVLMELAEEYERSLVEVSGPLPVDASRRQRVARATLEGALRRSQVEPDAPIESVKHAVSFRHLSLLARLKPRDEDIWASLRRSGRLPEGEPPSPSLRLRLERMRTWVASIHFPEELALNLRTEPSESALEELGPEEIAFIEDLTARWTNCPWEDAILSDHLSAAWRANIDQPIRGAFRTMYRLLLDRDGGPRLISMVVELDRPQIIGLLDEAALRGRARLDKTDSNA